jgi:ribonuclease HI
MTFQSTANVIVYLKGHANPNPGKAVFVALLVYDKVERDLDGLYQQTSANAVEIIGATEALNKLNRPCSVTLYSNCLYLVDEATKFLSTGTIPYANRGLWLQLALAARQHEVTFLHMRKAENTPVMQRVDKAALDKLWES